MPLYERPCYQSTPIDCNFMHAYPSPKFSLQSHQAWAKKQVKRLAIADILTNPPDYTATVKFNRSEEERTIKAFLSKCCRAVRYVNDKGEFLAIYWTCEPEPNNSAHFHF